MRGLLLCPCCNKSFDKRMLKKKMDGCPDIHCVGYDEMHLVEVDDPMEFPEDYYEWYSIKTHDNAFGNSIHGNEPVGAEEVISIVADYYNLSSHDVKSRKRQEKMVKARQISAYLLKEFCKMDVPDIAKVLDYRDSTSIMYSLCKCKELSKLDGEFAKEIDDIKKKVRG